MLLRFFALLFHYLHVKIEKNEMVGACGMYGGMESGIQVFGRETTWKTQAQMGR
jgi:hypothetical protein